MLNGDGPGADDEVPPKGLLPNAEEKGVGTGAAPKVVEVVPNGDGLGAAAPIPNGDGLGAAVPIPNGDGLGAAAPIPKGDVLGADVPNAAVAGEGAEPKAVDELIAVVAPKGDGFTVAAMPNGEEPVVAGNEVNGDGAAELVAPKPDDLTDPPPNGLGVGAAAGIVPNNDACPPNGVALDAVEEPKSPPPKGEVASTSSDMLLLSTGAVNGEDETSKATSVELPLLPQADEEKERLLPSVSLRTAPKGF
jgi:hypothetical protein